MYRSFITAEPVAKTYRLDLNDLFCPPFMAVVARFASRLLRVAPCFAQ
ncbi:Uncharacterised protein [Yersinia pekkanenii]|uniref:Uncharacterized protein n=1 Tax=Yersinia pekkanenii TaxID=1288385 RepID=A0A0T9RCI8_9GAMM|nr:Uncharacterised protein [Yersinia pekkanenii]CRY67320.1 Uncharacterised protein [Yersinia pekkanenii]